MKRNYTSIIIYFKKKKIKTMHKNKSIYSTKKKKKSRPNFMTLTIIKK